MNLELVRVGKKLDGVRGPGVINKPESITINSVSASKPHPTISPVIDDTGQYQGMVKQMVTQNVNGWDFVASHAIDT